MNIVLALDGSPESLEAARFLHRLPIPENSNITVVTALVDTPFELVPTEVGLQLKEAEKAAASAAFKSVEIELRDKYQSLAHVVKRSHPNHLIIETAKECDADLIVLGARGHNVVHRAFLGSTADYVANHARASVVIVRPDEEGKFSRADESFHVMLAYDGSPESLVAFDQMRRLDWPADRTDFQIAYLLGRPKLIPDDVVYDQGEIEKCEADIQELISIWSQNYSVKPMVREALEIGAGFVNLVMAEQRNLLFVGGTGKSALQRFFLGSTSRHVLHHAHCPIWIAREKDHA